MSKKYTLSKKNADIHKLYEWSVQDPDQEITFGLERFRQRRGKEPRIWREDFCGTALVASRWVKDHPERYSIGLDLDQDTLDWALKHNVAPLGKDAERVDLRKEDVRVFTEPKADIISAMNFSYFVLFPLSELAEYFSAVRRSLSPDGIFILDCYGGWESQQIVKEKRFVEGPEGSFGYIWHQADYDAVNNRTLCHIHFDFKKGKRWRKAFTYDWRLYTPAEVRDALTMAGFARIETYWDFEKDENACDYRPAIRAQNTPGWIAYIVAEGGHSNGTGS